MFLQAGGQQKVDATLNPNILCLEANSSAQLRSVTRISIGNMLCLEPSRKCFSLLHLTPKKLRRKCLSRGVVVNFKEICYVFSFPISRK